jgi:hypothetical protein
VTRPVSSKSRSIKAIASALAAKATTIPVITIACGTGSAANTAAAPFRAMMPNSKKNAAADQIEGENLTQRLRTGDEAVKAKTHQRRAEEPSQRCGAHRRGALRGGPATGMGRVTAMDSVIKVSMKRINGLAKPAG